MKYFVIAVICFPLWGIAQTKTQFYGSGSPQYFQLIEVTNKLVAISKPIDSMGRLQAIDSVYYHFRLTPYPDQKKKYEIHTSLKVLIYRGSDTLINHIYNISDDSSCLSFGIPSRFKTITFRILANTDYKRRWRKSFKHYSEQVVFTEIERVMNPRLYDLSGYSGGGCILEIESRRELEHYNYLTIDQIAIRLVPGVY